MAADVARTGFNVTHDLGKWFKNITTFPLPAVIPALMYLSPCSPAEALAKMKDQNISASFRDLFLPNGQPPLPGLFTRRPDLAAILDAVSVKGISEFYSGNLTQEMAAAVRLYLLI